MSRRYERCFIKGTINVTILARSIAKIVTTILPNSPETRRDQIFVTHVDTKLLADPFIAGAVAPTHLRPETGGNLQRRPRALLSIFSLRLFTHVDKRSKAYTNRKGFLREVSILRFNPFPRHRHFDVLLLFTCLWLATRKSARRHVVANIFALFF